MSLPDFDLYWYRARPDLTKRYDGDTFWTWLDQGLLDARRAKLRLAGVHAPERKEDGYAAASEFVAGWLSVASDRSWPLLVHTEPDTKLEPDERDTLDRWVATVWHLDTGRCLNDDVTAYLDAHPGWPRGY